MTKVPDPVEPGHHVLGYRPFDYRLAGGPEPRRGLPGEPIRTFVIIITVVIQQASRAIGIYSLGFPVGVGGHDFPSGIVGEPFDRQERHLQHRIVSGISGHLVTDKHSDIKILSEIIVARNSVVVISESKSELVSLP